MHIAKDIDAFVQGHVQFGKVVPGLCTLSNKDQANLLKLARVEVWFLGTYRGLLKDCGIFYAASRVPQTQIRHGEDIREGVHGLRF